MEAAQGRRREKKDLTKSQRKFMGKKSTRKMSQKFGQIRKAGFAIKKMTDKMTEGEQFVDFSGDSRAKYGARVPQEHAQRDTPQRIEHHLRRAVQDQGKGGGRQV